MYTTNELKDFALNYITASYDEKDEVDKNEIIDHLKEMIENAYPCDEDILDNGMEENNLYDYDYLIEIVDEAIEEAFN